jgi:hypothetical protein
LFSSFELAVDFHVYVHEFDGDRYWDVQKAGWMEGREEGTKEVLIACEPVVRTEEDGGSGFLGLDAEGVA